MSHYLHSIGYGQKSFEKFLRELVSFDIKVLVDVRSAPYSKWKTDFRKENLEKLVQNTGLEYLWLGNLLGGMPQCPACYENGKLNYTKVQEQTFFKEGIKILLRFQQEKKKVALMCAEENPKHCHRSKLIGNFLWTNHNISLLHIVGERIGLRQEDLFRSLF